jgi:aspartate carbamoyltransferase catalytic subunit
MSTPLNHFTHTDACDTAQLHALLRLALRVAEHPVAFDNLLSGKLMINLFFEASNRTRVSFVFAA